MGDTHPVIHSITVYPIKSFDGVTVQSSLITEAGALENDRRFSFRRIDGKVVNAKKLPLLHSIRTEFNLIELSVTFNFTHGNRKEQFSLLHDTKGIEQCFSSFLGEPVEFCRDDARGFPDDSAASGPTFASLASFDEVGKWFPRLNRAELMKRFRANIILRECPAFWEDVFFGDSGSEIPFTVGDVRFFGINPCARCPVPSRDSSTGVPDGAFAKHFYRMREATLPEWTNRERFDHFYRFAVNTRISNTEAGKQLYPGDIVLLHH